MYETSDILAEVLSYASWTPISSNAVLGMLTLLIIGDVSAVALGRVPALIELCLSIVAYLALGMAVVTFVPGCSVLVLGATGDNVYSIEMSYLYGLYLALFLALYFFGGRAVSSMHSFTGRARR